VLVAVIADTHLPRGARQLPEACVERLRAADLILHAGDLSSLEFLGELRAIGPAVEAVYGNADGPELREILPKQRVVEAGGARLGLVHIPGPALRRIERLVARFPDCDAVIFGHTHMPVVERAGEVWILNPGSPTERRSAPGLSMLELEIDGGRLRPELIGL
jgi:putative phosphoesterase